MDEFVTLPIPSLANNHIRNSVANYIHMFRVKNLLVQARNASVCYVKVDPATFISDLLIGNEYRADASWKPLKSTDRLWD
jgi:hypothetical protein